MKYLHLVALAVATFGCGLNAAGAFRHDWFFVYTLAALIGATHAAIQVHFYLVAVSKQGAKR